MSLWWFRWLMMRSFCGRNFQLRKLIDWHMKMRKTLLHVGSMSRRPSFSPTLTTWGTISWNAKSYVKSFLGKSIWMHACMPFFFCSSCPNFYQTVLRIQKCVTYNQAKAIFGFTGSDNIGELLISRHFCEHPSHVIIFLHYRDVSLSSSSGCTILQHNLSTHIWRQPWHSMPHSMCYRPGESLIECVGQLKWNWK